MRREISELPKNTLFRYQAEFFAIDADGLFLFLTGGGCSDASYRYNPSSFPPSEEVITQLKFNCPFPGNRDLRIETTDI